MDFFRQEHGQISGFLGRVFADHLAIALQRKTVGHIAPVDGSVLGLNSFLKIGEVSICLIRSTCVQEQANAGLANRAVRKSREAGLKCESNVQT